MLKKYLHKNTIRYLLLVSAAIATLLLVGYLTRSGHQTVTEWNLFKGPEGSIELYFTNHEALPKKYAPGQTAVVSFTLAIHDAKKMPYAYEIIQKNETAGTTNILTTGEIQPEDKQVISREVPITYSEGGLRSKIEIRFPDEKQSIHYWVERQ